jgi:ASC-1-like (ASCH) protein
MFDNFLGYMINNFEAELVVMGARLALNKNKIDVDIQKLTNYETFAEKYSKYIKD